MSGFDFSDLGDSTAEELAQMLITGLEDFGLKFEKTPTPRQMVSACEMMGPLLKLLSTNHQSEVRGVRRAVVRVCVVGVAWWRGCAGGMTSVGWAGRRRHRRRSAMRDRCSRTPSQQHTRTPLQTAPFPHPRLTLATVHSMGPVTLQDGNTALT